MVPMVFVDNLLDDGQAKAGTARLGGDIGFEDARQQLDREAGAVVGDAQRAQRPPLLGAGSGYTPSRPFQRVFGVAQQIVNDLAQLRGVAENRGKSPASSAVRWSPTSFRRGRALRRSAR
jgi:hypothetical protein